MEYDKVAAEQQRSDFARRQLLTIRDGKLHLLKTAPPTNLHRRQPKRNHTILLNAESGHRRHLPGMGFQIPNGTRKLQILLFEQSKDYQDSCANLSNKRLNIIYYFVFF